MPVQAAIAIVDTTSTITDAVTCRPVAPPPLTARQRRCRHHANNVYAPVLAIL